LGGSGLERNARPHTAEGTSEARVNEGRKSVHMRVLMTGPVLDAKGGIAACASVLVEHMSADSRVAKVDYVGLAPRLTTDHLSKIRLALRGYLAVAGTLAKQPDVAHVHTAGGRDFLRSLPLIWLAHLCRVPLVLHVHPPDSFAAFLGRGPRPVRRLKVGTVHLAGLVVVPSDLGRVAMECVGIRSRVTVVPNPIDLSHYRAAPLQERRQDLVYLGWLVPDKGIDDLLAVLPQLVRRLPSIRIRLCGPYGAQRVRRVVEGLGLAQAVRVDDWVQGAEKTELLGRARVLVLPSYSEGLPVVLLEAMASGTPCVATSVGGIPEVVKDGETGYLIEPGDREALQNRIEYLFSNDEAWERLSEAALVSAQTYDAAAVVSRLVDEYERVVNTRAPRVTCRSQLSTRRSRKP